MRLWLDDIRPAPDGWVWAKTVEDAIAAVEVAAEWVAASLDHDLSEEHYRPSTGYGQPPQSGTGLDFVDWMIHTGRWPVERPRVHSMNPSGAARMRQAIDRWGPYA